MEGYLRLQPYVDVGPRATQHQLQVHEWLRALTHILGTKLVEVVDVTLGMVENLRGHRGPKYTIKFLLFEPLQ